MSKDAIKSMTKRERQENFEFFIDDFIKSYRIYHTEEETVCLIKDMLIQKHITILPECLKVYGKRGVSHHLRKAIESKQNSKEYEKYNLERFTKEIKQSNYLEEEYRKNLKSKNKKYKLNKIVTYGTIATISISTPLHFSSNVRGDINYHTENFVESELNEISCSKEVATCNNSDNYKIVKVIDNKTADNIITSNKIKTIQKQKLSKKEIRKKKQKHKEKVLNSFKNCKSIKEIKLRQKELEKLKLAAKDKIYKDCPLSPAIQQFIYEQSIINKIPVDLTFAIIHTETRGGFDSSGEKYYNSTTNYDLGLTQQNSVYRVPIFAEKYGLQKSDACDLVQYNDFINICCAFLEYEEINGQLASFNPYEFAGLYNGWINWRENEISREYVRIFTNAYDNIYTKHHEIEKSKVLSKSKKNK